MNPRPSRVAVLTTHGVEESEIVQPIEAMRQAGIEAEVIAPQPGEVQAMNHDEKSGHVRVDRPLSEVDPNDYEAVVLPGGALNADKLRMDEQARAFVRTIDQAGKPIAAICHAPWLLVSAGMVRGRTLTSYYTLQDDVRNAGGNWVDQELVVDGNLITSRSPRDLPAFNRELVARLQRAAVSSQINARSL